MHTKFTFELTLDWTEKNLPALQETWIQSLGWEDPLEEAMATHSSILAWRIPWTEEPGGLQSMGSQRVRHSWATFFLRNYHLSIFNTISAITAIYWMSIKCINRVYVCGVRCSLMSDYLRPHGLYSPWNSPGQNTGVGSLSLLQGIFPTQRLEPRSPTVQADSLPAELSGKLSLSVLKDKLKKTSYTLWIVA